jgi:hypothetical protein
MSERLPEASAGSRPALPVAQLALDAYWLAMRHGRIYAGQVLALAAIGWAVQFATGIVALIITAQAGPAFQAAFLQVAYICAIVTVLLLGGTAMFISCQRAIVLGRAPAVRDALNIRPSDIGVLRAVCVYWLIVHFVPTVVVNGSYVAEELGLAFPRLSTPLNFAFYWGWVLATAPLVVLSLPITLFEGAADALAEGRRRLDGNTVRLFAASVIAFAPVALFDIAFEAARDLAGAIDDGTPLFWLFEGLLVPLLVTASSLVVILVMSALVAAAYLRLSPRLDTVYRVFD